MQASRASTRAIKALTTSAIKPQTRALHITGSTTFSSLLTTDKPVGAKPTSTTSSVRLPASATLLPVPDTTDTGKPVRHFNTSRSLKAVNDSSTIDFAYIPDFDPDLRSAPVKIRVPVVPWGMGAARGEADVEEPVMVPTIHTVAADGTHIHAPAAMSDMTDSNHIDFQGMAAQVANRLGKDVDQGVGMARQIWTDFVEDVIGPRKGAR